MKEFFSTEPRYTFHVEDEAGVGASDRGRGALLPPPARPAGRGLVLRVPEVLEPFDLKGRVILISGGREGRAFSGMLGS